MTFRPGPGGGQFVEQKIICHRCGVEGHKSSYCQEDKIPEVELNGILAMNPAS